MNRELARELKIAGFPMKTYQRGHRFFPREDATGWPDAARTHGVTVTPYELEKHLQDIESGYYCPTLSELIGACRGRFSRLFVMKAIWFAESDRPELVATGETPEEAVAKLWLALNELDSANIRPSARTGATAAPM
jgi:hypothetical protein